MEPNDDWGARKSPAAAQGKPGPKKGTVYDRPSPKRAQGDWFVTFLEQTWEALLAKKSWVLLGVMRSLVKRARSKGTAKDVDRAEVAAEVGCSEKQVSWAYGVLAGIEVRELSGIRYPLLLKVDGGHQGKCSSFEVHGYRKGRQKYPKKNSPEEASDGSFAQE